MSSCIPLRTKSRRPGNLLAVLTIAAGYVPAAWAQAQWQQGQNSTIMCTWSQPRAAVIQNTLYLDGGDMYWLPGFQNGTFGSPTPDGNPLGLVYTLDFSQSFNTTDNTTGLFKTLSRKGVAPNYYDGALLANNHEWLSYGGLLTKSDQDTAEPDAHAVFGYQKDMYGADKAGFSPGFYPKVLPNNLTRYLAYGGAASAPSENKAWYFGGLGSPSGGPIYTVSGSADQTAYNLSNTLVELDLTTQQFETWQNLSLPANVSSRANPELVWVPVGAKGILVVLGGVVYPNFIEATAKSSNESGSRAVSPAFMVNMDIYDIAAKKWYKQPTMGGPGQLTRGCAVVARAQDGSSYNIYYYGGYDGLNEKTGARDEVWILSLPSFMWMKLSSGSPSHARIGHKCVTPYPDQMMVVGGYTNMTDTGSYSCVQGGVVQMLNMTDGSWMNAYDPNKWNNYSVPAMIYNMIGGDGAGGATQLAPTQTGFADGGLSDVFQTPYPATKITTYYPYASGGSNANGTGNDGGGPNILGPVLGAVLGVAAIATALAAWCLFSRRRRRLRAQAAANEGGDAGVSELGGGGGTNGHRTMHWVEQQTEKVPPSETTEATATAPGAESRHGEAGPVHHEMEVPLEPVELMDTSAVNELGDTGLSHTQVIEKHSHLGQGHDGNASLSNPSYSDPSGPAEQASLVSHSTAGFLAAAASPTASPTPPPRPQPQQHGDMVFGTATGDDVVTADSGRSRGASTPPLPPPTPPVGDEALTPPRSAGGSASGNRRRSMFLENPDDLDGPNEGAGSRPSVEGWRL